MKLRKRNKLVFGVGVNDADYKTRVSEVVSISSNGKKKYSVVWICPYYKRWNSMLQRCYQVAYQKTRPTYIGCSVCDEWLTFSKFKTWMQTQDWEGKELDKDIIFPGNKVYGAETCVFVSCEVNLFASEKPNKLNNLPTGVSFNQASNKYQADCFATDEGRGRYLGLYETSEEAHAAWLKFKIGQAYILAAKQTDPKVAKALIDRYENYGHLPKAA